MQRKQACSVEAVKEELEYRNRPGRRGYAGKILEGAKRLTYERAIFASQLV